MDFPWHKPSSYGGTHDLGNLPYMFWFWSIPERVNQWRILHHLWRSPASTWAHFFMASWPLGSLWDWITHLWLCQLSWCFSSSMSVVSSKNTQIPWVLPKAPLQNYPNISISWKPFGKFRWNNWGCLKIEGNVPNFDGLSISFPLGWVAKHWGIFPKSFHPWRVRQ